jgi:FAD/FMN-containing dehydrogenase
MASLDRRQFLVGAAGGAIVLGGPAAQPAAVSRRALRELRAAVKGRVTVPGGSAALVYNTRFDGRRPDAVVHVRDTADVAAAVRWANRFDVRLIARSGGHSYAGYSTTSDGVVLDLSHLRGIRVSGGRATVGPAAQLIDVQRALTRRGSPSRRDPARRSGSPASRSAGVTGWPDAALASRATTCSPR